MLYIILAFGSVIRLQKKYFKQTLTVNALLEPPKSNYYY